MGWLGCGDVLILAWPMKELIVEESLLIAARFSYCLCLHMVLTKLINPILPPILF